MISYIMGKCVRNKEKDTINTVMGKNMAELRGKFNLSQREIFQVIGVNRNTGFMLSFRHNFLRNCYFWLLQFCFIEK